MMPAYPLPEEFAYLKYVCEMDGIFDRDEPSKNELRQALDLYLMTLAYFGRGAWSDDKLSKAFAWAWMAGYPECVVLTAIRVPVLIASYRYAIRGGSAPRIDLLHEQVSPKIRELFSLGAATSWLPKLMEEYRIEGWERINYREWNPDILEISWIGAAGVPTTARTRTRENAFEPMISARSRTRA